MFNTSVDKLSQCLLVLIDVCVVCAGVGDGSAGIGRHEVSHRGQCLQHGHTRMVGGVLPDRHHDTVPFHTYFAAKVPVA